MALTRAEVDEWLHKQSRSEPLTRGDLRGLMTANGGTARGIDLSNRDMSYIDLASEQDYLSLVGVICRGADLRGAKLQKAPLNYADLRGAKLTEANLEGAIIPFTKLEGAEVYAKQLVEEVEHGLDLVDWGNFTLGLEKAGTLDW